MHSDATLGDMAKITVPNKVEYCRRHGYDYYQVPFTGECHSWPGYDRIPYLIALLKSGEYDWIFWLGCDALITNLSIKLEELTDRNFGMVISTDAFEVQMDSFLVQPRRGGIELMEEIWATRDGKHGPNYEQSNLARKIETGKFRPVVKLVPQRVMNSFDYSLYPASWGARYGTATDRLGTNGQWQPRDFVFHVPGKELSKKISELQSKVPSIVRNHNGYLKEVVLSRPLSEPKICILTCHDQAYSELARRTVYDNKAEYALLWNHDLLTLTGVNPEHIDPASHVNGITWDRLREAVRIAKTGKYDWLWLVGADTLITNMTIPLSTIIDNNYHFIIANDFNGWNADSFFIRCTPQGISYMEEVMAQEPRLKHHPIVEQQAMIELREKYAGVWKEVPPRAINAYNMRLYFADGSRTKNSIGQDADWRPGDFLIHWAGQPTDVRFRELEKVWPKIIR